MLYELDLTQKRKLTAVPDTSLDGVDLNSFIAELGSGGDIVTLEIVPEEPLTVYAIAKQLGAVQVVLSVNSLSGTRLEAIAELNVTTAPATAITIEVGEAEPI